MELRVWKYKQRQWLSKLTVTTLPTACVAASWKSGPQPLRQRPKQRDLVKGSSFSIFCIYFQLRASQRTRDILPRPTAYDASLLIGSLRCYFLPSACCGLILFFFFSVLEIGPWIIDSRFYLSPNVWIWYYKRPSQLYPYPTNLDTLYFHFHSVQYIYFYFPRDFLLDPGWFRGMLFSFQVFVNFPIIFLLSICSLWLENTLHMTLILLNLMRFDLWCRIWSTTHGHLEKNVLPAAAGCGVQ